MNNIVKPLNKVIEYLLILLIAIMVLACIWQVLARYILGQASAETEELMRYAIIWASVIGGAYVYGENGHLAITFFANKMSKKVSTYTGIFIHFVILLFSAIVLIYGGYQIVSQTMIQLSPGIGIPIGYVYLALPIAGVMFILYALQHITDKLNKEV